MKLGVTDFGGPPDGPELLLGPSLGTTSEALWGVAAALLAERFRVIAWELPGHSGTEPVAAFDVPELARAVLAIADEQGWRTFAYAGDSIGGAVGLQLLLDAPHRIRAATLLCTGARIGEPAAWHERAAIVRASGTATLVDAMLVRWFGPGFADREPARAHTLLAALATTDDASYAAACVALADFDVRDRLAAIAPPVLAVAGTDDGAVPVASLRRIATSVQNGRLVVLDGVGHQAPAEVPEQVARLVASPGPGIASPTVAAVRAAGMQVRREVLGDQHVDRATAGATDFTADFQELITRYAWGSIWTRPGLDRRSRSMITLTALVARGHHEELALHIRAARRNGLTVDEIKEVLLQAAIYCGVPDANTAFRIAQRVLSEPETE
ncbi:MAG TPA: 4-carboxymuconolactone decarboxylase [Jatrophihabitantaceae bacterium]|jgi:3-oxoadipate enol-lactonase/4-carboxymuconolactone decarboxylase